MLIALIVVVLAVAVIAVAASLHRMPAARAAAGVDPASLPTNTPRERRVAERRQIERRVRASVVAVERRGVERRVAYRRADDFEAAVPRPAEVEAEQTHA